MASVLDVFDYAFKEYYSGKRIERITNQNRILLSKLTKNENFVGDVMPVPVIYEDGNSTGGDIATVRTNATNSKGVKFNITVGTYFTLTQIDDKVLTASRSDIGAFLSAKQVETDSKLDATADRIETYLFGNGGYAIGKRASESSGTVTLTDPESIVNFHVDQVLVASTADGTSGSLKAGSWTVTAVDPEAGTFDYTGTITSDANDDYLFEAGTWGGSEDVIQGLGAWIPATAPGATAFFGVDRSAQPVKLGGCRVDSAELTNLSIEQRLRRLASRMTGRFGGPGPTDVFLHPERWEDLAQALESRRIIPITEEVGGFGFEKLVFTAGGARINVWSARKCSPDTAFALHMPSWELQSMLKVPHVKNGDGLQMLRQSDNTYEMQWVSYPQLVCRAPGFSGRVALPTA